MQEKKQIQEAQGMNNGKSNGCPFHDVVIKATASQAPPIYQKYPNLPRLDVLRKHSEKSNPMDKDFNYVEEFKKLDYWALKEDLKKLMTESQDWWPADFGHYGGLFIRLAWHSAGSYRVFDGRGGANTGSIRFGPRIGWPDNANLDKAIRLLWPIKKKYGKRISWADLIILAGNVAMESMGFKTLGFSGGREDVYEAEDNVFWGPEEEWLDDKRHSEDGKLDAPLAATQMGLIYVNPEGPGGKPDPVAAAKEIRDSFARMGMNDEETVALIAGGHSFGKAHGAVPKEYVGPEPLAEDVESMGLGWKNKYGKGHSEHTFTSGLEGSWTTTPTKWSHDFFKHLFEYDWEPVKSPAGGWQWKPKQDVKTVPDAFDPDKKHPPMMLTTDLALRYDPIYEKIARRFYENPEEFEKAFARAWFKLTHRDMGPPTRYVGPEVPKETFLWQDPLPERDFDLIDEKDAEELKRKILSAGHTISELVLVAWAAASTYRNSDKRGGVNGARIRLKPQIDWEANNPPVLRRVLATYEKIKEEFNSKQTGNKRITIADLIVLGGIAGIEEAIRKAGYDIKVPFTPGRVDAGYEHTDVESFCVLEPVADGFRNYYNFNRTTAPAEHWLVDKADLLTLSVPEMVVLLAGLRTLGVIYDLSDTGVLTKTPGVLNNQYFVNLLDMRYEWKPADDKKYLYYGYDRKTGEKVWTATRVDLILGHDPELRAICEVYGADDANEKFIKDFVKVWDKVMMLDRFDLHH